MLQLMVVSYLQQRFREDSNARRPFVPNLGALLLEFFGLYGGDINVVTTGISVLNDGSYFPKGDHTRADDYWSGNRQFQLAIENPLEPGVDVGKSSFKVGLVCRSFSYAHKVLLSRVSEPRAGGGVSVLQGIISMTRSEWKASKRKARGLK